VRSGTGTDGSLNANTTIALSLPVQCVCSIDSIRRVMTIMESSSKMLSTTTAVHREYCNHTVRVVRSRRDKGMTDDRVALLGDLRPRRTCIAPESDHEHSRDGREYADDHSAFGDELVPAFGT
jgi:hypothetical protein